MAHHATPASMRAHPAATQIALEEPPLAAMRSPAAKAKDAPMFVTRLRSSIAAREATRGLDAAGEHEEMDHVHAGDEDQGRVPRRPVPVESRGQKPGDRLVGHDAPARKRRPALDDEQLAVTPGAHRVAAVTVDLQFLMREQCLHGLLCHLAPPRVRARHDESRHQIVGEAALLDLVDGARDVQVQRRDVVEHRP